ncbi:UDP-3-O-acyl-N-acetylglucosamine deacetylase [Methyloceanibacter stevinii]|uniref:UDP-3-O-acyl-N-acetylglucosamine deacetylase n=1 Tax=Methyloceanibacter stevinii TaxID=1774970 RepID=UPI0013017B70|nr:UDP-3-O-acyl-N-acetylglucosamine deacetylase [Methyloceanibacter stevinii]
MKGFIGARQTTLANEISLTGIGVHSGAPVSLTLCPADSDTGLRFLISNDDDADGVEIAADQQCVSGVTLCTVLGDGNGASVATVEHVLAALRGLGVDNALIEIDSGEVPIMDGSAAPFVEAIDEVGIAELEAPRRFLKVLKPICVEENGAVGELTPYNGFHLDVEIDFETPLIGKQNLSIELNPGAFRRDISRARTFGFMRTSSSSGPPALHSVPPSTTPSPSAEDRVINREGLRYADEFVRHKALDAVGDLALAGAPILGAYRSRRGGHRLNALVLKELFADPDAWTMVEAPRYRDVRHAELTPGLAAAHFAADRS